MVTSKKYGSYKRDICPFCKKTAYTKNSQNIPVCYDHKTKVLRDMKCYCGEFLELREGKYGSYFFCMNCNNISFKKALLMNSDIIDQKQESNVIKTKDRKDITITSDEVDMYYS